MGFWILWFRIFSLLVVLFLLCCFALLVLLFCCGVWCFHFVHCIVCDVFLWCVLVALLFAMLIFFAGVLCCFFCCVLVALLFAVLILLSSVFFFFLVFCVCSAGCFAFCLSRCGREKDRITHG